LISFASYYNNSGPIVAVVLGGTNLPLGTQSAASGITWNSSDTVTVANAGSYRLSYCVETTAGLLVGTRIVRNGTELPGATLGPVVARSSWCRSVISTLAAGDTLQLQMYGLLGAAVLTNPGGVSFNIEQIQ
jgi:hypothetical protein